MSPMRAMIEIDEEKCDGCGICIPSCHEGALAIVDGKARLVSDSLCDGLGACLGECPQGALRVIEREAVPFVDPHAPAASVCGCSDSRGGGCERSAEKESARHHAAHQAAPHGHAHDHGPAGGGCPGSRMRQLRPLPSGPVPPTARPVVERAEGSALGHWPVQIRLIPPHAPFLRDAELLVAADCVPVACPTFHSELLPGKAVMVGCPKFDPAGDHVERFAQLFAQGGIRKVTVAVMEVPCCAPLAQQVFTALQRAGKNIPFEVKVVEVGGSVR